MAKKYVGIFAASFLLIQAVFSQGTLNRCTPDPLCPSADVIEILTCSVIDDDNSRATTWTGNSTVFDCEMDMNRVVLSHFLLTSSTLTQECGPAMLTLTSPVNMNYTSTLSVAPSLEMDGATIRCLFPNLNTVIQECVLDIISPPAALSCTGINSTVQMASNSSSNITLSWTGPGGPITDYIIEIQPGLNDYPSVCRSTINNICMVPGTITEIELPLSVDVGYTISIRAMNCDSQVGTESPLIAIILQVPPVPTLTSMDVTYDSSSRELQSIIINWSDNNNIMAGNIVSGCVADEISGAPTQYFITVNDGFEMPLESQQLSYTYSPSMNSTTTSTQLSVVAENIVGRGNSTVSPVIENKNPMYDARFNLTSDEIACSPDCIISVSADEPSRTVYTGSELSDRHDLSTKVIRNKVHSFTANFTTEDSGVSILFHVSGTFTPLPSPPANGFLKSVNEMMATYSCDSSYELVGDSNIEFITETSLWSMPPSCKLKDQFLVVATVVPITVLVIIAVVVVVIIIAYIVYRSKKGKNKEDTIELKKPRDLSPPPLAPVDQGATYADPNDIKHETGPETGELYAVAAKPSKKKKNQQQLEELPTYQDPNAIQHQAAGEGGDMYAIPEKKPKKGSKKKTAPEPQPTEEELQQMYSQPDKTKKAQNQGLNYADIDVVSGNRNPPAQDNRPGEVTYTTVTANL